MKWHLLPLGFLLYSTLIFAQLPIEARVLSSKQIIHPNTIGIDHLGSVYLLEDNTLSKIDTNETLSYNNILLGNLTQIDIRNPMKVILFYRDFNTLVILDNRLSEIFKIDFNQLFPLKNITQVSSGVNNSAWLYNLDSQSIERFNYKEQNTQANTLPLKGKLLALHGDNNHCWALTDEFLYQYNYFGSELKRIRVDGFTQMKGFKDGVLLLKNGALFFFSQDATDFRTIALPQFSINSFFASRETLYICEQNFFQKIHLEN